MRNKCQHIVLLMLLLTLATNATAQKKKTAVQKEPPMATEEADEQAERMERMLEMTQKIMIVDSMVVEKKGFLKHYSLNHEAGTLSTYQDFFQTQRQPNSIVYANERGNICYMSQENNADTMNLYISERIGGIWTRPTKLRGVNDQRQFSKTNYPFMMADGTTLYFAAQGEESIGGYDIFITRYDSEDSKFRKPDNVGMPFNSAANDYMLAIDEYDNIGWFASDRNQQADSVCIYIFVPSETRTTYDTELYTKEQIESRARIDAISDTWDDDTLRTETLKRLNAIRARKQQPAPAKEFAFDINDDVVYTKETDFQLPENIKRHRQLVAIRKQYHQLSQALEQARNFYATANEQDRRDLSSEIIENERRQHTLYVQINHLEKEIRNTENMKINQNK